MFTSIAHAMGAAPQGGEGGAGAMLSSFMPIILIIVVFYFMLIRPQQKRAKQHKEMLASLRVGDKVVTNSGFFGTIVEMKDDHAVVDLGESKVVMLKGSLSLFPSNQKFPIPSKKGKKKGANEQDKVLDDDSDDETEE